MTTGQQGQGNKKARNREACQGARPIGRNFARFRFCLGQLMPLRCGSFLHPFVLLEPGRDALVTSNSEGLVILPTCPEIVDALKGREEALDIPTKALIEGSPFGVSDSETRWSAALRASVIIHPVGAYGNEA